MTRQTAEMTTVDARHTLSEVINRVAFGNENIVLTRRGKPIVAIMPAKAATALPNQRYYYVSATVLARDPETDTVVQHFQCVGGRFNSKEWGMPHETKTGLIRQMIDDAEKKGERVLSHEASIYFANE